jgi:hypothetical protein
VTWRPASKREAAAAKTGTKEPFNLELKTQNSKLILRGCTGFDRGLKDLIASRGGLAPISSPTQINANNNNAGIFAADNYAFAGAVAA